MNLKIGAREIGPGLPCFIVAEVGLAHDGSLMAAHAYIDACVRAGVDAMKWQCHLGDTNTEWRVLRQHGMAETRQDYWRRTGFHLNEWAQLAGHCRGADVEFLCSPFSVQAVEMLDPLVPAWKVPSGKVTDTALLRAIGKTRKPALLSTGMATAKEIAAAWDWLADSEASGDDVCPAVLLMQCTSLYPCAAEQVGLQELSSQGRRRVREMYPVGLSDHSGQIYPGIAAAALGCQVLEVHVCFSKEQGGFDTAASLDMGQLRQLVEGVRFVEAAMKPIDKDLMAKELGEMRRQFMGVSA